MSAVRQFRAEGERPLKVPSPPAPTAVFTGVRGRAGRRLLSFLLAAFGGCLMDVKRHILRRSLHESGSLLWSLGLRRLHRSSKGRAFNMR